MCLYSFLKPELRGLWESGCIRLKVVPYGAILFIPLSTIPVCLLNTARRTPKIYKMQYTPGLNMQLTCATFELQPPHDTSSSHFSVFAWHRQRPSVQLAIFESADAPHAEQQSPS